MAKTAIADITNAAKELEKLEAKLGRLVARSEAAITKATNKAKQLYGQKTVELQNAVDAARTALQALVAAA